MLLAMSPSALWAEDVFRFSVREYRVTGAKKLERIEVERAVYPFMGPQRTPDDVEQARLALEKAYHRKGFQSVSVVVPTQDPRTGVIVMQVVENRVGRLRVKGANYFLPSRIKQQAPSLTEGTVPDFEAVSRDMVALNRLADRRVTPQLRVGVDPGTIDVDLIVEDELPLHGSFELNNRYSANTTQLRLNGALSYANLFQRGHTIGANFQLAPENLDDAQVYSAYYLFRLTDDFSLMLQGTHQNSDISTLGGAAVGGRGQIYGVRGIFDLPSTTHFLQSLSLGLDYKNFEEDLVVGDETVSSPIEYFPLSLTYGATWLGANGFTETNHVLTLHLRGMGSDGKDYANKRYKAEGNFVHLRSDVARTQDLKNGSQIYGKLQAQVSSGPLINSEQFAGGGLGTARGYLEGTAQGDHGGFLTLEWRTPSFIGSKDKATDARVQSKRDEWRAHVFADAGIVGLWDSLPQQESQFAFASAGFGTRFRLHEHYNGSLDVAFPFVTQAEAEAGDVRITFRGWAEF